MDWGRWCASRGGDRVCRCDGQAWLVRVIMATALLLMSALLMIEMMLC